MVQLWHYHKITLNLGSFSKKTLLLKIKQILENYFINLEDNLDLLLKDK